MYVQYIPKKLPTVWPSPVRILGSNLRSGFPPSISVGFWSSMKIPKPLLLKSLLSSITRQANKNKIDSPTTGPSPFCPKSGEQNASRVLRYRTNYLPRPGWQEETDQGRARAPIDSRLDSFDSKSPGQTRRDTTIAPCHGRRKKQQEK
jgi:hypothetical protein